MTQMPEQEEAIFVKLGMKTHTFLQKNGHRI